jgi:hypothetical protein
MEVDVKQAKSARFAIFGLGPSIITLNLTRNSRPSYAAVGWWCPSGNIPDLIPD